MTSSAMYRSSTLPCRRHPLRSTRLHPRRKEIQQSRVSRMTECTRRASSRRAASRRVHANGTEKSAGATCPNNAVPRFCLKSQKSDRGAMPALARPEFYRALEIWKERADAILVQSKTGQSARFLRTPRIRSFRILDLSSIHEIFYVF
jgi:hypothetical protein